MKRHLLRRALRLPQAAIKRLVTGLLQLVLLANRPARLARSGFVLPTTVLLVLMVVLTATALTYRSFTRSDMAISQREQQEIANAATPALDRARAKIEFLFNRDTRLSSGLPTGDFLASMMLTTPYPETGVVPILGDPFTLPGETRLDINGDNRLDNAWSFVSDNNDELITYSILVEDEARNGSGITIQSPVSQAKANALVTRTGPLATTEATSACSNARAEKGWQVVNDGSSSALQKNFQVNVFVPNANNANRTVESFEFQQSRIANRGNKWAAWFRYDMEIFAGPEFNINGAMHTDSSLMVRSGLSTMTSFMISSHNSCVYSKEASEITVGATPRDSTFQGQIVRGVILNNVYGGGGDTKFHTFRTDVTAPNVRDLTAANDSVSGGAPADVAVNPLVLYTEDRLEHTNPGTWTRDAAAWDANLIRTEERIFNKRVPKPFVDDFFRADNRWGPKPRYSETDETLDLTQNGSTLGDSIGANDALTNEVTGFDGYWERQATEYGLRMIVGQRLELGNPKGWNFNPPTNAVVPLAPGSIQDRLYPPNGSPTVGTRVRANEYRQKRSLIDNLAAAQAMAIYHYTGVGTMAAGSAGTFPTACYALTAHPGTPQTIVNSRTFGTWPNGALRTDFLTGQGTNGWEFKYHPSFDTAPEFAREVVDGRPLGIALRNMSYFAGDPSGGAPSFPAVQEDNLVHPYPHQAMWGDFSPLRRIVEDGGLESTAAFGALSSADQATVHTAACTLGLLAYQMQQEYDMVDDALEVSSLQTFSQRLTNLIGTITEYIGQNDTPTGSTNFGGSTLVQRMQTLGVDRVSWIDKRVSYIIRNERARRDAAGNAITDANGRLIIEGDAGADLIDGVLVRQDPVPRDAAGREIITRVDPPTVAAQITQFETTRTFLRARSDEYLRGRTLPVAAPLRGQFNANQGTEPGGAAEYFASITLDQWLALAPHSPGGVTAADLETFRNFANQTSAVYSLIRDRDLGFRPGQTAKSVDDPGAIRVIPWDPESRLMGQTINVSSPGLPIRFRVGCDPNIFRTVSADGGGGDDNVVVAGLVGCSARVEMPVKYPSLYYLFPLVAHDHDGEDFHAQPPNEEYIAQAYIRDQNGASTRFRPVVTGATDRATILGTNDIAAVPTPADSWVLPTTAAGTQLAVANINNPDQAFTVNAPGATALNVSFLDKGMFDGREQMGIRVLDTDLQKLTTTRVAGGTSDFWLSNVACDPDTQDCDVFTEGIVYAFREDAVREDEIVRPAATASSDSCLTVNNIISATCRMVTTPGVERDPPLTAAGISLKPVDFFADPDRRPNGFRLRNGADMSNNRTRAVGMTFVTDNSTYVMGDFNLHSTNGTTGTLIEEFTNRIGGIDWTIANFYNNRTEATIDERFSQPLQDTWRPVEILTDAFTILSAGFLDGAAQDTYIKDRPGGSAATNTSYMNQSRPNAAQNVFREDGTSSSAEATASPIFFSRNGAAWVDTQAIHTAVPAADWTVLTNDDNIRQRNVRAVADPAYVNAVFISGVVPNRIEQSNGGLHNFPRLLEDWNNRSLQIAGAFFQLNFATGSTGPYEHDNWQPDSGSPDDNQRIGYYRAPTRRWGYDPGLLYYPPAAAARRFVSVDTPRNEYFRELPADDPYIANLRCARDGGEFVYIDESIRGTCPPPA